MVGSKNITLNKHKFIEPIKPAFAGSLEFDLYT